MSGKSCLLIFGLILSLVPPWPPGELGTVWAASCDVVLDYGADPTFTNPATIPIQNAIDDAHAGACDGEVHLPPGTYKITDAIKLKSNVTLNISSGATLKVSEDQSDLSSIFRVVHVDGVSNVVIRGGGTIDASGPFYHNSDGTRVSGNRPGFLLFVKKSDHITVENVLLKDTVEWTFTIYDSDYVSVDNIIIRNPEKGQARNTDGIDIVASRHVTVRNCDIETGDDAITLKSTPFDEDTWHNLPDMHDILVEDTVVASTCNATKIGTETSNDIYDVTFRNITVNQHGDGGRNTAGIIVQSNDGNSVHDIAFINYTINKAYCPIFIGLQDRDEYISGPIGSVYNITFKNIHSTQSNPQPIFFNADEDGSASIENVVLENITIHNFGTQAGSVPDEMDGDYPNVQGYGIADAYGLWARDTKGLIMRGCINFYDDGNSGRVMTALWDNVTDIIDERTDPDDCAPAPEANCSNGLDDDHDGQTDCLDLDCDGFDQCEYATESTCGDNIDNNGDGHTDCRDSDCSDAPNCDGAAALQADFNSGEDGFFYADDEFNDTDNPFFASGDHRISDGYQNSGCVHVKLGNVNGTDILNGMSGGWTTAFLVNNPAECRVRLRYRQVMTNFDADECAQAMVKIDDGPVEILADLCGRGQDTGWEEKILHRSLQPGDHTITVGGYNNKKTSAGEVADIYFDDIEVTQGDITTPETNCSNGFDDDHDGESDCLDIDCDGVDQCEFGTEITCDDYFDNDGDTQVDCDDTNCRGLPECPAPPESECSDGRDDDSDGLTDCRDSDCDGIGLCEFGTEISCDDDTDNDGDGHTDCNDMDCAEAIHCVNLPLLFENFNGCDHSLIYEDDEFYGTNNPLFASGECIPSGGVSNSGELHVLLGNVNGMDILDGISGGWKGGFYLHGASEVKVSLDYRLIMTGFDADECAQVLARIDDRPSEVLEELCGQGKDTGWQSEAFMRSLSAGEHTITIGGYNNKKTGEREFADIYFDNVEIR